MQPQRYIADTIVTCDANNSIYSPGVIDIEEGKITWVGDLGNEEEADMQTSKIGGLLMPGLVNAHTHLEFSGLERPLGTPGMAFPDWIRDVVCWRRQTDSLTTSPRGSAHDARNPV